MCGVFNHNCTTYSNMSNRPWKDLKQLIQLWGICWIADEIFRKSGKTQSSEVHEPGWHASRCKTTRITWQWCVSKSFQLFFLTWWADFQQKWFGVTLKLFSGSIISCTLYYAAFKIAGKNLENRPKCFCGYTMSGRLWKRR